ncbi:hypothetical protein GGR50DRAFT_694484 [Xylaria sp. CBS 124048]|nr:hypothetical protein GGR50DRAFT_694484 [Xylaria sp. CBS 124048]
MFRLRSILGRLTILLLAFTAYTKYRGKSWHYNYYQAPNQQQQNHHGHPGEPSLPPLPPPPPPPPYRSKPSSFNFPTFVELYLASEITVLLFRPFWRFWGFVDERSRRERKRQGAWGAHWRFVRLAGDLAVCWLSAYMLFMVHLEFVKKYGHATVY